MTSDKNESEHPTDWSDEYRELSFRGVPSPMPLGGEDAIGFQHSRGKNTVRERIEMLLDPGSFHELGKIAGKGAYDEAGRPEGFFVPSNAVIRHWQGYLGAKLVVSGDDYTIRAGFLGVGQLSDKWVYAERLAHEYRMPLVRLVDTAGGSVRILEQSQSTKIPRICALGHQSRCWDACLLSGMGLGACAGLGCDQGRVVAFLGHDPWTRPSFSRAVHRFV